VQLKHAGINLLPAGTAFEVAGVCDFLAEISLRERETVASWALGRRYEFSTGRYCARRAFNKLGLSGDIYDLLADADGIPCWPAGFSASISHSRGVALAAVAPIEQCALLGVDLEKTNRISIRARQKVVHPLEVDFTADDQVKASILFSLKEAFYKAQFPRWRTVANFHDLALQVDLHTASAHVQHLDRRFAPELSQLQFRFQLVDDYVLSFCWM
jgi:4'-phosphopantetheinyl transferase EntD